MGGQFDGIRSSPLCPLLCILLAGCGGGGGETRSGAGADAFSQTDSAGIAISVTAGRAARRPLPWRLDSVPSLDLGTEGAEGQTFFQIAGVRKLPDGRVLVVDGGSRELRYFDESGALVERVGRRGEGPNEFEDPSLVPAARTDSVLVWDVRLHRFHRYTSARGEPELIRPEDWPGGRAPLGIAGDQALVSFSDPLQLGQMGPVTIHHQLAWIDVRSGRQVALDTLALDFHAVEGPTGVPTMFQVPFTSSPTGVVAGGRAWITGGRRPEIRVHDGTGRLVRLVRVEEARRPVTGDALRSYGGAATSGDEERRRFWEDAYASSPLPDSIAAFRSLMADDLGFVWAELYDWGSRPSREWMVFDEQGRAVGVLATPFGLDVREIGSDFVLGVEPDDLGIERVREYALQRE